MCLAKKLHAVIELFYNVQDIEVTRVWGIYPTSLGPVGVSTKNIYMLNIFGLDANSGLDVVEVGLKDFINGGQYQNPNELYMLQCCGMRSAPISFQLQWWITMMRYII